MAARTPATGNRTESFIMTTNSTSADERLARLGIQLPDALTPFGASVPAGRGLSVNVGAVREFEYGGRRARSAIWKSPAVGRIVVRGVNLAGDHQADRKAHGGPDKVVYAYAVEDARWWEQQIGRSL